MRERFARAFGGVPAVIWSAPGRVNLIGEHIDYAGGDVLPIAIAARTYVAVGPIAGSQSHVSAGRRRQRGLFDPAQPVRSGAWWDYLAGASLALSQRGIRVPPLAIAVAGDVPAGAGLSSSAALCVATAGALSAASGAELPGAELAAIAHEAESSFVGVPCGIMDQHASALGRTGFALHLRCRDATARHVPFGGSVLIFDTAEPRALRRSRYEERRREVDAAFAALQALDADLEWLADAPMELLERAPIAEEVRARARHVITEQARVARAVRALEAGERIPAELLLESHASLRDDFRCSTEPLDWFVDTAVRQEGITGARLTGAGWGGCAIAIGDRECLERAAWELAAEFTNRFGRQARWWITTASEGARAEVR